MNLESRIQARKAEINLLEAQKQAIEEQIKDSKHDLNMLQDLQRLIVNAALEGDRDFS
jgi:cell division protein FtsB